MSQMSRPPNIFWPTRMAPPRRRCKEKRRKLVMRFCEWRPMIRPGVGNRARFVDRQADLTVRGGEHKARR